MAVLRWANAAYVGVIHALAYFSVFLLVAVTGWIGLEVMSRIFGFGILRGSVEFTEYAIFNMAFLSAPWILHQNAHVRVLFLMEMLGSRRRRIAESVVSLVSAAICAIRISGAEPARPSEA